MQDEKRERSNERHILLFQVNADPKSFYDIDAFTVKLADQSILMIIFGLTLISFLVHIIFRFRYRYSWHRISIAVDHFCSWRLRKKFSIFR